MAECMKGPSKTQWVVKGYFARSGEAKVSQKLHPLFSSNGDGSVSCGEYDGQTYRVEPGDSCRFTDGPCVKVRALSRVAALRKQQEDTAAAAQREEERQKREAAMWTGGSY